MVRVKRRGRRIKQTRRQPALGGCRRVILARYVGALGGQIAVPWLWRLNLVPLPLRLLLPLRLGWAVWFVLVRHNPVRPGIGVLDAQDVGDLAHALRFGELRGRSLHVLLERLVR